MPVNLRLLALTVRILTRRLCRCAEEALPKIAQQGFLRSKQTSAAGDWPVSYTHLTLPTILRV